LVAVRVAFFNGHFVQETELSFDRDNRAFRYGDGCFETIRFMNGVPVFWTDHWSRMSETLRYLFMESKMQESDLARCVQELIHLNGNPQRGGIRITAFREGAGLYIPDSNAAIWLMTLQEEPKSEMVYAPKGKSKTGVVLKDVALASGDFGNYKTLSKTLQVVAALHAKREGVDDGIILNEKAQISEAVSSNLFLVIKDKVLTPPLSSGCLNGTVRNVLIRESERLPLPLMVENITIDRLSECTEIWLCNARIGLTWFDRVDEKSYGFKYALQAQALVEELAFSSIQDFPGTRP